MKLSELIKQRDNLNAEIYGIILEGTESIDRLLWERDEYSGDEVPKDFEIRKYGIEDGKVFISWCVSFRGEVDYAGRFYIPEVYFNDADAYRQALDTAKVKEAEKIKHSAQVALELQKQAEENTRRKDAILLEQLLSKRERGEI